MRFLYLLVPFIFIFSGCTPSVPKVTEYRIDLTFENKPIDELGCKKRSIKVLYADSPKSLMKLRMNYGVGENKLYMFSQAQWSDTPNMLISYEFIKYLKGTELFASVQSAKSRSSDNLILEISIEDFMQYFSEDELTSYADVAYNLTLIDARTRKVISSEFFESRVDVDELSAYGGVKALSKALSNTINDSESFFTKVCK